MKDKEKKWTNKEVDSTIAVIGVFFAFSMIISTIMILVFRQMEVSPDVIIVFQGCKELVLIILAYFFGRAKPKETEVNNEEPPK